MINIKVSDRNHEKLLKIKTQLENKTGKIKTLDDVIDELICAHQLLKKDDVQKLLKNAQILTHK
jgi:hypothetical protein